MKEIQRVLNLPEMKVIKPSNTRWLAHERCLKAVKVSYTALVVTLDSSYQNFHAPEALGLQGSIQVHHHCSHLSTGLHFTISGQACKSLQTKQLDSSMISSLIDAVLHALDDAITPAAHWVLELLDSKDNLQATGEIVGADKIHTFQETVGTPFVALHKENISSRYATHNIVSALAIFDPRNLTRIDSSQFPNLWKEVN